MSEHTSRRTRFWQLVVLNLLIMTIFAVGLIRLIDWFVGKPATLEIHYAPAENLEAIDVRLIESAKTSIDMAAYVLTDIPVIEALRRAAERGVTVRIFRDVNEHDSPDFIVAARDALMASTGVAQKFTPRPVLMHLKSYCIDGKILRTGAANFSASGLKQQDNDLIILPGQCAGFEANFNRIWGQE